MRTIRVVFLFSLLAGLSTGCGRPPGTGAACAEDRDCDVDQYCLTDIAGGYCTEACESDDDCPARSACARFDPADELPTCLGLCIDTADCQVDRPDDPNVSCVTSAESLPLFVTPDREGRLCLPDP